MRTKHLSSFFRILINLTVFFSAVWAGDLPGQNHKFTLLDGFKAKNEQLEIRNIKSFENTLYNNDDSKNIALLNELYSLYGIASQVHLHRVQALLELYLALYFKRKGEYEKASAYFFRSLGFYFRLERSLHKIKIIISIGDIYRANGDYKSSLRFLHNARHLDNLQNKGFFKSTINTKLAAVYFELAANNNRAADSSDIMKIGPFEKTSSFNTQCKKLTLQYSQSALLDARKENDTILIIENLNILGAYFYILNEYQDAISYYEQAIDLMTNKLYDRDKSLVLSNLSICYNKSGNKDVSLEYVKSAYEIANNDNINVYLTIAIHNLFEIYKTNKQFEKALRYKELEDSVNLHIINENSRQRIDFLQEQFQSQQKAREIQALSVEKKSAEQSNQLFVIIIISIVVVIIFSLLAVYIYLKGIRQQRIMAEEDAIIKADLLIKSEESHRVKSEFLANISHEIRTPMNAMLGYAELLNENISDQKYHDYIQGILHSGKNLLSLLNDILDLSKIEAGKAELHPEPLDLNIFCMNVAKIFDYASDEKKVVFKITIQDDSNSLYVLDEIRLKQIFLNLVGNSFKFTSEGEINLKLFIQDHDNSSDIIIEIKDTGIGIRKEQLEKVFDAFYQDKSEINDRLRGGSGLGMTISRKLVQMMGGTITLDSKLGEGTTVRIQLPEIKRLKKDDLGQDLLSEEVVEIRFQNARVLLVEDNEINLQVLKAFLNKYPFEIKEAHNGKECIEVLSDFRPDIILMDLQMPVMDGFETLAKIRENNLLNTIPVIAITAYTLEDIKQKTNNEFQGYLYKPVSPEDLKNVLMQYLPYTKNSPEEKITSGGTQPKQQLSEEVVLKIKSELLPMWLKIKKLMSKDEIEDFSIIVKGFGEKNQIQAFVNWAELLQRNTKAFDIRMMYSTFVKFHDVVNSVI